MARRPRIAPGGLIYHVVNRAAGRRTLFSDDEDFAHFEKLMKEHVVATSMRLLAYSVMPNHLHLVLWPRFDGDLSDFMQALTGQHAQAWRARNATTGQGSVYQGRFGSFPVQDDGHLLTVCRYVERNALTANLVQAAELWQWSSLWRRECAPQRTPWLTSSWPVARPVEWTSLVNAPVTTKELEALQRSLRHGRPLGEPAWAAATAGRLGLGEKPMGRPKRAKVGSDPTFVREASRAYRMQEVGSDPTFAA
jgi:putative transposase